MDNVPLLEDVLPLYYRPNTECKAQDDSISVPISEIVSFVTFFMQLCSVPVQNTALHNYSDLHPLAYRFLLFSKQKAKSMFLVMSVIVSCPSKLGI